MTAPSTPLLPPRRQALRIALTLAWVLLLGLFFAQTEIQIEGPAGWAANLPTWRVEQHWLLDIFWGGRAMTGYHAWVFPFIALFFHFPFFFMQQWSPRLECRALGCIMLFWIVEDFLWFVLNPAYGLARFDPVHVAWHKHWLWLAPTDYWVSLALAAALLTFSYRNKTKRLSAPLLAPAGAVGFAAWKPAAAQEPAPAQSARDPLWATQVEAASNLHRVTPTFYRSARLKRPDVVRLQALGVKTVVSLRALHSDDKLLANSGIRTVRIPINTWHIKDAQMVQALRAIRGAERDGPVLLHCLHGADRTGLVAAMYRVLYQQRSKEQALDELKNGGYGYHTMWKNIERYLRKVDVEAIRRGVEQA